MPTPSPTIDATIGAYGLTSITPQRTVIPAPPTASPATATRTGRPAATTERNISSRIVRAATMPISSPVPLTSPSAVAGSSPPSATCSPSARVGATASSRGSA